MFLRSLNKFLNKVKLNIYFKDKGALIFTYGVTNSGKTYTVVGTNNEPGILIQTMRELYKIRNDVR